MTDVPPPFDALWFKIVMGMIVGLALGSFTTMLSYRLPRKLSLTEPSRSFCPSCKTLLKSRDLMPLFSWAVQGGTCHYCNAKISARYPLIELATATLSALAFVVFGFQPLLIVVLIGIVVTITGIIILVEHERIR